MNLLFTCGLFVVASPLVAFSLYFALIHTPRALIALKASRLVSTAALWRAALLTMLSLVLAAAIYLTGFSGAIGNDLVRTGFMLLSALTVHYMALGYLDRMIAKET